MNLWEGEILSHSFLLINVSYISFLFVIVLKHEILAYTYQIITEIKETNNPQYPGPV